MDRLRDLNWSNRSWPVAIWTAIIWRMRRGPICTGGWGESTRRDSAYQQALSLVRQEPERRFLEKRLVELG